MARIAALIAATLAAFAAGAQDLRFVAGREPAEPLDDTGIAAAQVAIDALAKDLGIAKDGILVDTVRAVEWRDSSLGCPRPGMNYLSVITPGHKVTLRVDGELHVVHEADNRAVVCPQDRAATGLSPHRDLSFAPQMLLARKDLAERLGVTEHEILFMTGEGKTWPDGSLGCPQPGEMYTQAEVRGWVLTFRHRQRLYTYHTDLQRTIPCPPISAD